MAKTMLGLGGRGTVTTIERKPHPNSHFEPSGMRIERKDDGTFDVRKEHSLKKKFRDHEEYMGGYRDPETGTAQNAEDLMAHVRGHFGSKKVSKAAAGEPKMKDSDGDVDDGY